MTNDENLALLKALCDAAPFLLPERTLFAEVNIRLFTVITYDAFRELLRRHKEKRRIACVDSEDGLKWKLTDDGFARLQELR